MRTSRRVTAPIAPAAPVPEPAATAPALSLVGGWRSTPHSGRRPRRRIADGQVSALHPASPGEGSVAVTGEDPAGRGEPGRVERAGDVHTLGRDRSRPTRGVETRLLARAEARILPRGRQLARLDTAAARTRRHRDGEEHGDRVVASSAPPGPTLVEKQRG